MIISSAEVSTCPDCSTPLVRIDDHRRQCNSCGFVCEVRTEQDEIDIEEDRRVRSRSFAEEKGGGKTIGKGLRW